MTTELEKQFFDTFEIKPETGIGLVEFKKPRYPHITDRHYLELLALCQRKTYEEFKKESLQKIIIIMRNSPYHISQVQELFKGE